LYRVYMHGESGDVSGAGVTHTMTKMPLLVVTFTPEDVYNMDETGLFHCAQPNKTLVQGRVELFMKDIYKIYGMSTEIIRDRNCKFVSEF
jgi:hypothetical protein